MTEQQYLPNSMVLTNRHRQDAKQRCLLFANLVEEYLLNAPFIKMVPQIKSKILKSVALLYDSFQDMESYEIEDDN